MSHATTSVDRPTGETLGQAAVDSEHPAVAVALEPGRLDLFAERTRQLRVTDPQGRLLTISCGAALHHARTALTAAGWSARVARLPDVGQPDLVATLTVTGRTTVTEAATRLAEATSVRHTDRRPVSDRPLPAASVDAIAAARAEGQLHICTPDQVLDLAAAVGRGRGGATDDPRVGAELAHLDRHSSAQRHRHSRRSAARSPRADHGAGSRLRPNRNAAHRLRGTTGLRSTRCRSATPTSR